MKPVGIPVRGVVQIVHGMCEYFSRHTPFAKHLCSQGFIVCGHDLIGHGASAPNSDNLGFFALKDGWKYLIEDVGQLREIMEKGYPDLPYFMVGHSMGSMILRLYLTRHSQGLSGAIISGTTGPNSGGSIGIALADILARVRGMTYRSKTLHSMVFGSYNKPFVNENRPFAWLSRDRAIGDAYEMDEKCNFIFTVAGFRDLFQLVYRCNHRRCFQKTPKDLPLLLISGDQDPVGGYGKGVSLVYKRFKKTGHDELSFFLIKNDRHEIFLELDKEDIFYDVVEWINENLN